MGGTRRRGPVNSTSLAKQRQSLEREPDFFKIWPRPAQSPTGDELYVPAEAHSTTSMRFAGDEASYKLYAAAKTPCFRWNRVAYDGRAV
jgi:hypothetical protein